MKECPGCGRTNPPFNHAKECPGLNPDKESKGGSII